LQRVVPYLFPHLSGKRAGARLKDFKKAGRPRAGSRTSLACFGTTSGRPPSATG
jgi:hypothetical protein